MRSYGFLLPTPVSIQPRVSAFKDADRVVYAETSKNEDTWYRALSHYDAEFDTAGGLSKDTLLLAVALQVLYTS